MKDIPGGDLVIHSVMHELNEEEERDYRYETGRRHYSFVLVKMRLFHPQDEKVLSNTDLCLALLNTNERK